MSNLDNIIADIENVNKTYDFWIRDENGNIKDDVICGNIIPFLKELKDYEVDMTQEEIESTIDFWYNNSKLRNTANFWGSNLKAKCWGDNTYNHGANIDHDIDYRVIELESGGVWFAFMVHRYGDVRGNYTDWAVCKFDYVEEIFELESTTQTVEIDNRYVADICIFNESYYVWDYINNETVGCFYEIEKENLMEVIKERCGD